MDNYQVLGTSVPRLDGKDKVAGRQRYVNDKQIPGLLHAALKTSTHAHAEIKSIDISKALEAPGVQAVLTGEDFPVTIGLYMGDKPPIARSKVRHYGEAVAVVIANSELEAKSALPLIHVEYQPLPYVSSPREALKEDAPILHKELEDYKHIPAVLPEPGTNISNRTKIRKGDIQEGFKKADFIIESSFEFPPGDHVAMETRATIAEIGSNGDVKIQSATQAPFLAKALIGYNFNVPIGKINVTSPPVGGGFGGKAGLQLEGLVYLLSRSVDGRPVKLVNTREQDLLTSPGHIGLQADVKLGCTKEGELVAAELTYLFDGGAYADYAVNISRAAAISCTGPYRIPNVWCDSLCVYTNHPFATAYRGFGHIELAYAIERSIDLLAEEMGMDSMDFRLKNAIQQGDTSPTQSIMDANTGDLRECIRRTADMIGWKEGIYKQVSPTKVRAKGMGLLWKAPAMPTNTDAGVILTFNEDGSMNFQTGVVEIGQGTHTGLAQIIAEKFKVSTDMVHVVHDVNTKTAPHDWATAASRGLMMAGRAAIEAADDAISQLKRTASIPLRCPPQDLEVAGGRVFLKDEPEIGILVQEVAMGYVYPNGNAVEGQVIGRGRYVSRRLSGLDPETGEGHPALEWTLGAEAIEVELDLADGSYDILNAVCCMDVGTVINPDLAHAQVVGALGMGLSFARNEGFIFNNRGQVVNEDLRSYKILRYGEEPQYQVEFLHTPQGDGPFDARGLGEQGVVGMPGALSNALSRAAGKQLNFLPLTPESIWKTVKEVK
ncbi:xanthine dehydrogenase family protein molybdopterin-binding subunit [Irregularibacter muris]|uniref:Xanthine dehydrogenase family protein molybdopterin-binding subunit n=1 Tax=Irregularibacter muris TaxID=1796619 RepID=A0AAE3HF71_9FIRM|nr:xanthine dehydrogenase family protein molybdopterin-binding subunit [Irregularibacter muris]MCR1899006.1 xanthine dehydrogenase family protein molybdopterin-binding subunit [Irregularibacter muris]